MRIRHNPTVLGALVLMWCVGVSVSVRADAPTTPAETEKNANALEQQVKALEANGWSVVNMPDEHDSLPVTARLQPETFKKTKFQGELRYSWVVALPPVSVEGGGEKTVTFSYDRPRSTEYLFESKDGKTHSFDIMEKSVQPTTADKPSKRITLTQDVPKGHARTFLYAQEMVEVVENGKVVQTGYLNSMHIVELKKKP